MKRGRAWRITAITCLSAFALSACGGISSPNTVQGALDARLSDPGWDQPAVAALSETPLPAPSLQQVDDFKAAAQNSSAASARAASWEPPQADCDEQGEMWEPCNGDVWERGCNGGCNDDGRALEQKILDATVPEQTPYAIGCAAVDTAHTNHFSAAGGTNNPALSFIYQVFSNYPNDGQSHPDRIYSGLSYRADGGPLANGVPCNAPAAFVVSDFIFWKLNSTTNALPGGNSTALYNILIAPSSERSESVTGVGGTTGSSQNFYMGSLNMAIYGGSQIVSLESSNSSCEIFRDSIANNRLFYTNPIYGVLLKRWQDAVVESMDQPYRNAWDTEFGWPVQGPIAYNNGSAQLSGRGAYYAWGMYFERGFMWWVDYINNANTPDEAQAYLFSGEHVFCKQTGDRFIKLPTIFYGGTGPLGVSVIVEASLNAGGNGYPPGSFYEVANPVDGPPILLDMHAHGYGGAARESDGRYKHYTWAFRDGTTLTNDDPFDDVTKYVQHAYQFPGKYTVRVQVIDAKDQVAYGDSLPIHVGLAD